MIKPITSVVALNVSFSDLHSNPIRLTPREGYGNPLQYSCLEKTPMDEESGGCEESDTDWASKHKHEIGLKWTRKGKEPTRHQKFVLCLLHVSEKKEIN